MFRSSKRSTAEGSVTLSAVLTIVVALSFALPQRCGEPVRLVAILLQATLLLRPRAVSWQVVVKQPRPLYRLQSGSWQPARLTSIPVSIPKIKGSPNALS